MEQEKLGELKDPFIATVIDGGDGTLKVTIPKKWLIVEGVQKGDTLKFYTKSVFKTEE